MWFLGQLAQKILNCLNSGGCTTTQYTHSDSLLLDEFLISIAQAAKNGKAGQVRKTTSSIKWNESKSFNNKEHTMPTVVEFK